MSFSPRTRLVNPWLGTYFGIFVSLFAALVLMLLMLEQLGITGRTLGIAMLAAPILLYAAIGIAAWTEQPAEYFGSGRRVPAFFAGLGVAISTIGATGIVAGTGLFFINGFDAWALAIGAIAGCVVMAVLVAPFFRKFGAYTVPGFLGRRFDNRLVRITAAALMSMPILLIIAAELRIGAFAIAWLVPVSPGACAAILAVAIVSTISLGGMRSLTWSSTAQGLVTLLAILVPTAMVAVVLTNLPLPQLSYGPVLRAIGRLEASQGVAIPILSPLAFGFAGPGLEPLARRMATPFGSIGHMSFILTTFSVMLGVAAAPWLLPRTTTTPGVYEVRKSLGWSVVLLGIVAMTISAVAVFMRDLVMDTLVGHNRGTLPEWFGAMVRAGLASLDGRGLRPPLEAFSFHRDGVLFALPIAYGYPTQLVNLVLAGAVAAALAAAGNATSALSTLLAEDVVGGTRWVPPSDRLRLAISRVSLALVAALGGWVATTLAIDPVRLVLWAMALSAATAFPVMMLAIWWKRLNAWGATAGMLAGFVATLAMILASESALIGVPSAFAAMIGVPAGFIAAIAVAWVTPAPGRHVLEVVRDLRMPGGETLHDREIRLQRLKQRQSR